MVLAAALMVLLAPCMHDDDHARECGGVVESLSGSVFPPAAHPPCLGHSHDGDGMESHCHGHSHEHDTTHHHPRVSALPGGHKTAKNHACPAVAPAAAASNPVFSCDSRPAGAFAAPPFRIVPSVSLPLLA